MSRKSPSPTLLLARRRELRAGVRAEPALCWSGVLPLASAAVPFDAAVARVLRAFPLCAASEDRSASMVDAQQVPASPSVRMLCRDASKPGRAATVDGGALAITREITREITLDQPRSAEITR